MANPDKSIRITIGIFFAVLMSVVALVAAVFRLDFADKVHTQSLSYQERLSPALQLAQLDGERLLEKKHLNSYVRVFVKAQSADWLCSNTDVGLLSQSGNVWSAVVACENLTRLAESPGVAYVDEAGSECYTTGVEKLRFHNELDHPSLEQSAQRRSGPPLVGIVEQFIDPFDKELLGRWDHGSPYFAIWDQTDQGGYSPREICNSYGTEHLSEAIYSDHHQIPIWTGGPKAHGTQVARTIAKYVDPSVSWQFIGVKTNNDEGAVIDAVNYIQEKARQLDRPVIVNLSIGSSASSHDGRSLFEHALTQSLGPGELIVVAAGNLAESDMHARIRRAEADVVKEEVLPVHIYAESKKNHERGGVRVEMWFKGNDLPAVTIKSPEGRFLRPVYPGNGRIISGRYGKINICHGLSQPQNGDQQVLVIFADSEDCALTAGVWQIRLLAQQQFSSWTCDAWVMSRGYYRARFTDHLESQSTVTSPGTACRMICAGAGDPQNCISFSPTGLGPTRDGRSKPDLWCPKQTSSSLACAEVTGRIVEHLAKKPDLRREEALKVLSER